MTLLNFICCWLRSPNERNIDEMFESCLFLQDRQEILEEMSRYNHTPATISKLRRPSDQCPLLLVACVAGDPILVDLLLEEGGGGSSTDANGESKSNNNNNDMLSSAWDDNDGNSPLLCACLGGHTAVVDVLLDSKEVAKSPDLLTRPNKEGTTPIIAAAWRGHLAIVQKLSKMPGVTLTHRDSLSRSAKDLAAEWGHKTVVEWIDNSLQLQPLHLPTPEAEDHA